MKRIRILGLVMMAVFATGAIASTAAQAVEAPGYGVEGARLKAGSSVGVTAEQKTEYKLTTGGVVLTCKKSALVAGATITGSETKEPGTSKETITFKECSVANNGTCTVGHEANGEIVTKALKNELVYDATSKESKSVAVEFTPETGAVLSNVTFNGAGCTPISAGVLAVEGQAIAQAWGGTVELLLELGMEAPLVVAGSVVFPSTKITSIILFVNGVGTQKTVSLAFAGKGSKLEGSSQVVLAGEKPWCIIS